MTHRNLTCTELDEQLGDYLDRRLDDSAVAALELHLSGCPTCSALVRDFERITRDAAKLPAPVPSHDLWPAIAARLDAPVVDLGAHAAARQARVASASWRRLRTGAMAAGLVGITAITTWWMTRRDASPTLAAQSAADSAPATSDASRTAVAPVLTSPTGADPLASVPSAANATTVARAPRLAARETYNAEITSLRGILTQRRDELDPRTVAILESSISTIDSAIAEARHALDVDPASRFLSTQLNKALEKKLGLLRTAALLPART